MYNCYENDYVKCEWITFLSPKSVQDPPCIAFEPLLKSAGRVFLANSYSQLLPLVDLFARPSARNLLSGGHGTHNVDSAAAMFCSPRYIFGEFAAAAGRPNVRLSGVHTHTHICSSSMVRLPRACLHVVVEVVRTRYNNRRYCIEC